MSYMRCCVEEKTMESAQDLIVELGDNPDLSIAESIAVMCPSSCEKVAGSENFFKLCGTKMRHPLYYGSILRVAKPVGTLDNLEDVLLDFAKPRGGGILWALISVNLTPGEQSSLKEAIQTTIKSLHRRSIYVDATARYSRFGELTVTRAIRKGFPDSGTEFLGVRRGGLLELWRTISYPDLDGFIERDFARPCTRPRLSMPPSLANSLINLTQAIKPNARLLDPFCGTGTILLEAANMGFTVVGLDVDYQMVACSLANLKWLTTNTVTSARSYLVMRGNATHEDELQRLGLFDCIVTEPPLGPILERPPEKRHVEKIMRELTPFYNQALKGLSRILDNAGRIVLTTPVWKAKGGIMVPDSRLILKGTGLVMDTYLQRFGVRLPITWRKPDNIVQRSIYILRHGPA